MADIFETFRSELADHHRMRPAGRVSEVAGGVLRVLGLNRAARLGDRVEIRSGRVRRSGEAVALGPDGLRVLVAGPAEGIGPGDLAMLLPDRGIAPGDDWLGRIVDPAGRPLDGRPLAPGPVRRSLRAPAPAAAQRRPPGGRLDTGLAAFDTFLPLGSLHYQALIGDQVPGGGDFILELTGIPNVEAVWQDFYAHAPGVATHLGYERNNRPERYGETHGHWRIGDQDPSTNTCISPGNCPGQSGIVFRSASESSTFAVFSDRPSEDVDAWESSCTGANSCNPPPRVVNPRNDPGFHQVNIGDINVNGLLIQQLRITTCSTVNGAC